jgi:hypothetical protein
MHETDITSSTAKGRRGSGISFLLIAGNGEKVNAVITM